MRYKRLFGILLVFFILFITVGVASAAGDVGVASVAGDVGVASVAGDVGVASVAGDVGVASVAGDVGVKQLSTGDDDNKTFSDIQVLIDNARSGDSISLSGNYSGDGGNISINKAIRINGNGAVLDGNGLGLIFAVSANGVFIDNVSFINGNYRYGGAISLCDSSSVTVTNCYFIDNHGDIGGAVSADGGCNLTFTNCDFTNNSATYTGGSIYLTGYDKKRDDVYCNLTVVNCNFSNSRVNNNGGAVSADVCCNLNFKNTRFMFNNAGLAGGVVFANDLSTMNFTSCDFMNNSAKYGGALYSLYFINVISCNFTNNSAIKTGGAISICLKTLTVDKSNFNYNVAQSGPAIYNQGVLKITNSYATDDGIMTPIYVDNTYDEEGDSDKVMLDGALIDIRGNPTIYIVKGEKINLTATVTISGIRVSGGSLVFKVNGEEVNSTDLLNATYIAEYTLNNAVYVSATYNPSTNTKVNKLTIWLAFKVEAKDVYFDKGIDAKMYLPTDLDGNLDADGDVYFKLDDGEWFIGNISGVVASYTFYNASVGQHNLTIKFDNDSKYSSYNTSVIVKVNKKTTSIKVNDLVYYYGDNKIEAYIYDSLNNTPLEGKVVNLAINGNDYSNVSDSDGKIVYYVDELAIGTYKSVFTFEGDEYYTSSLENKVINITKRLVSINVTNTSLIYEDNLLEAFIYDSVNNTPLVNENVSLKINNKYYYAVSDLNGLIQFNIDLLTPNTYEAVFNFSGNSIYNSCLKTVTITISKKSTYIDVSDISFKYGDTVLEAFIYDINDNPLVNKTINLNINGTSLDNVSDIDGKVIFDLKDYLPGEYIGYLEFLEDDCYSYSSNSSFVSINKLDVNIISSDIVAIIGSEVNLVINVSDEKLNKLNNVNITLTLPNSTEISIPIIDGIGGYNFTAPTIVGNYPLNLSYAGNEIYNIANSTIYLNATKIPVNITLSGSNGYYKSTYVTVKLSKALENQTITLKLNNGKTIKTVNVKTNAKGIATYCIPYATGTYTITASSTHENYSFTLIKSLKIKVYKASATIYPYTLTTTYASGDYFKIKVLNSKKQVMVGVKLKLSIYTGSKVIKTVYVTTGSNGIAQYSGSYLSITKHKVIVRSAESTTYMSASAKTSYITVKKGITIVYAPKVTNKYKTNSYFKITVKNKASGKLISGLYLKVKVYTGSKYTTYTIKTNSKGVAYLNTKSLKKGTHKVVITSGSSYYTVSKSGNLITIV